MSDVIDEIEQSVEDATSRGVFNIVEAVRGRAYPKTTVTVYLDEDAAYTAASIDAELEDAIIVDGDAGESERTKELKALFDATVDLLKASECVFTIRGISEGSRDKIMDQVLEQCPIEYDEVKNQITGITTKVEIENKERDRLFTQFLWAAQIESITAANGDVQHSLTVEDVAELRKELPLAAVASINEAIDKVRVSTAVFMSKVNEDFLAKR